MEVSEKDLADRKRKTNETAALSFRLGADHVDKLRILSQRSDTAQVDIVRNLIDGEWARVQEARRR